eukprot:scaffold60761_cov58-Phaeocystis_antarctica.AAC.2
MSTDVNLPSSFRSPSTSPPSTAAAVPRPRRLGPGSRAWCGSVRSLGSCTAGGVRSSSCRRLEVSATYPSPATITRSSMVTWLSSSSTYTSATTVPPSRVTPDCCTAIVTLPKPKARPVACHHRCVSL